MTALILITGTKETCSKIRNTGQKMKQTKIQTQHSLFSKNLPQNLQFEDEK